MKTYPTAREAIIHSQREGEMAQCEHTPMNRRLLDFESDGCNGHEYWADDPDDGTRMSWRVNLI